MTADRNINRRLLGWLLFSLILSLILAVVGRETPEFVNLIDDVSNDRMVVLPYPFRTTSDISTFAKEARRREISRTASERSCDLTTRITPCQFGGRPVCTECGCIASGGLAAIGRSQLAGLIPVSGIFSASQQIGSSLGWIGHSADSFHTT